MWSEYYKNFAQADKVQYQKKLIYPMGHYSPIRIKLKVAGSATFNICLILHGLTFILKLQVNSQSIN